MVTSNGVTTPMLNNKATLAIRAHNIAITKLEPGPAAATNAISRFGLCSIAMFTGTGFAQPIKKPLVKYSIRGTNIVPTGSMCLNGFKLKRPSRDAVESPKYLAVHPCATSWSVIANNNGGAINAIFRISSIGRRDYTVLSVTALFTSGLGKLALPLAQNFITIINHIDNRCRLNATIAAIDYQID